MGYKSPKNFYAALKAETGLTPSDVRNLTESDLRRLLDVDLAMNGTGTGIRTPVRDSDPVPDHLNRAPNF